MPKKKRIVKQINDMIERENNYIGQPLFLSTVY